MVGPVELDKRTPRQLTIIETTDGKPLSYFEQDGLRLYRGPGLRKLTQEFDPSTFRGGMGSEYGNATTEQRLVGFAVVGKRMKVYYGLDTDGVNTCVRAVGGIFTIQDGEDLPDTVKVRLTSGPYVYFPTAELLGKLGVQRRS